MFIINIEQSGDLITHMKFYLVDEILTYYNYDTDLDIIQKVKIKDNSIFIDDKEKIPIFPEQVYNGLGLCVKFTDKKELTRVEDPEWFCPICFEQKEEAIVPVCDCEQHLVCPDCLYKCYEQMDSCPLCK